MKYLLVGFCVFFYSCMSNKENNQIKNEIVQKVGTTMIIPDSLSCYPLEYSQMDRTRVDTSMIVFIDGQCFTCVEDFVKWKDLLTKYPDSYTYKFYVHAENFDIIKSFLNRWKIDFPIYLDSTNAFCKANKISPIKLLQVFVVDENEKILFVGNPLYSESVKKHLYRESRMGDS